MNTFYHIEGAIYKTEKEAIKELGNYSARFGLKCEKINTNSSWEDFEDEYTYYINDGFDYRTALEMAI